MPFQVRVSPSPFNRDLLRTEADPVAVLQRALRRIKVEGLRAWKRATPRVTGFTRRGTRAVERRGLRVTFYVTPPVSRYYRRLNRKWGQEDFIKAWIVERGGPIFQNEIRRAILGRASGRG